MDAVSRYNQGMTDTTVAKFPAAVEDAIRGIRANFPPRRVMVFDRTREWGGALVKAGGDVWIVSAEGKIFAEERDR